MSGRQILPAAQPRRSGRLAFEVVGWARARRQTETRRWKLITPAPHRPRSRGVTSSSVSHPRRWACSHARPEPGGRPLEGSGLQSRGTPRGGDAGVTQQALDAHQISATLQQPCREIVAQDVRCEPAARQAGSHRKPLHQTLNALGVKRAPFWLTSTGPEVSSVRKARCSSHNSSSCKVRSVNSTRRSLSPFPSGPSPTGRRRRPRQGQGHRFH